MSRFYRRNFKSTSRVPRGYSRKFRKSNSKSAYNKASKALALVQKMQRTEEKKYDINTINLTVAIGGNAGQVQLLNGLVQGTSGATRLGDKIALKTLSGRINVKIGNGEVDGCVVRMVIVYDRDSDGVAPSWSSLFGAEDLLRNYDFRTDPGKLDVLCDKTFTVRTDTNQIPVKFWYNLKDRITHFQGNAGTIADITKGALYVMFNTINNTVAVDVDGQTVVRFTDA